MLFRTCRCGVFLKKMSERKRSGTRVSCDISATLAFLNHPDLPPEPCRIIIVNPQECGIRFHRPLELGTRVQLQGLPTNRNVIARVMNCTDLRPYDKFRKGIKKRQMCVWALNPRLKIGPKLLIFYTRSASCVRCNTKFPVFTLQTTRDEYEGRERKLAPFSSG